MKTFGCKNEDCGCVVEVEGRMAFGRGELDRSNHWEVPCEKCAREKDKENLARGARQKECWPVPAVEKTEVQVEMERFGEVLQTLSVGTFGGFLTIRPKTSGKPMKVFIWNFQNGKSFYISVASGIHIEEVILA